MLADIAVWRTGPLTLSDAHTECPRRLQLQHSDHVAEVEFDELRLSQHPHEQNERRRATAVNQEQCPNPAGEP